MPRVQAHVPPAHAPRSEGLRALMCACMMARRDIKNENILLCRDASSGELIAKLADLGLHAVSRACFGSGHCSTAAFMPADMAGSTVPHAALAAAWAQAPRLRADM